MTMRRVDPSVVSTIFTNSVLYSIPIDLLYATTEFEKDRYTLIEQSALKVSYIIWL